MFRPRAMLHSPSTILAGVALPFIQDGVGALTIVGLGTFLNQVSHTWPAVAIGGSVTALSLIPAILVGLSLGRRQCPWYAVSTVSIWLLPSEIAIAWLWTDPVQGGIEIPADEVRQEFVELIGSQLLFGWLPSIIALLVAWELARRFGARRSHPPSV